MKLHPFTICIYYTYAWVREVRMGPHQIQFMCIVTLETMIKIYDSASELIIHDFIFICSGSLHVYKECSVNANNW